MSRSPQLFRKRDITKAIKGAIASGLDVARVEIDRNGGIVIVFGKPAQPTSHDDSWDEAIAELESQ